MAERVRIAIAGAGLVGKQHLKAVGRSDVAEVSAIVEPGNHGSEAAAEVSVPHFTSLDELIQRDRPDGILLATPNAHHVDGGLAAINAGIPVLIEKPIAIDVDGGRKLVEAAREADVPLLIGHHRRHNPLISGAKSRIDEGGLGQLVTAHGMFWLKKPDDYYEVLWRTQEGAGPVYINLIHDIDLLRYLCGDIVSVQASEMNAIRGNPVEDAAAMILRFESGALGTFSVTDAVPSPWSWELTAKENPAYPPTQESCYWIGGTKGSLALPNAALWSYPGPEGWWDPISLTPQNFGSGDPLLAQIDNFAGVIRGIAEPVVSGEEGLKSLAVIEAIKEAARSGTIVTPESV